MNNIITTNPGKYCNSEQPKSLNGNEDLASSGRRTFQSSYVSATCPKCSSTYYFVFSSPYLKSSVDVAITAEFRILEPPCLCYDCLEIFLTLDAK